MGVQHAPVGEMEQLMFASPFDVEHARSAQRAQTRRRDASGEGGMFELDAANSFFKGGPTQAPNRAFDFWEFRHRSDFSGQQLTRSRDTGECPVRLVKYVMRSPTQRVECLEPCNAVKLE
jgi:hypothetical protein